MLSLKSCLLVSLLAVLVACTSPPTNSVPPANTVTPTVRASSAPAVAPPAQKTRRGTETLLTSDVNLVNTRWSLRYQPAADSLLDQGTLLSVVCRQCLRCLAATERYEDLIAAEQRDKHTTALREAVVARLATIPGSPRVLEVDPVVFQPPPAVKAQLAPDGSAPPAPSASVTPTSSATGAPTTSPASEVSLESKGTYWHGKRDLKLVTRDKKKVLLDLYALWQIDDAQKAKLLPGSHRAIQMVGDELHSQLRTWVAQTTFPEVVAGLGCSSSAGGEVLQRSNAGLGRLGIRATNLFVPSLQMTPEVRQIIVDRMIAEVARQQEKGAAELEEEGAKERASEQKKRDIDRAATGSEVNPAP